MRPRRAEHPTSNPGGEGPREVSRPASPRQGEEGATQQSQPRSSAAVWDRGGGPSVSQQAATARRQAWEARSLARAQLDRLLAAAPYPTGDRRYDDWGSLPALQRLGSSSQPAIAGAGSGPGSGEEEQEQGVEAELAMLEAGRLLAASGSHALTASVGLRGAGSRSAGSGQVIQAAGPTPSARLRLLVQESTPPQALHGALSRLIPDASGFLPLETVTARLRQLGIKQLPAELVRLACAEIGVGQRETSDSRFLVDTRRLAEFLLSGGSPAPRSRAGDGGPTAARPGRQDPRRDQADPAQRVTRLASRCSAALAALVQRTATERVEDGVRVVDIRPAFRFLSERGTDAVSPHDLHTQLFRLGALQCDPACAAPSDYVLREPGRGSVAPSATLAWIERAAVERLFGEVFGPSALQRALDSRDGSREAGTVEEDWALAARPAFDFGQFARWAMPLSPRLAEVRERLKRAIRRQAMRGGGLFDPKLVFARLDADGSGSIDAAELRSALGPDVLAQLSPTDLGTLIQSMDSNGDGQIELRELVQLLFEAGED